MINEFTVTIKGVKYPHDMPVCELIEQPVLLFEHVAKLAYSDAVKSTGKNNFKLNKEDFSNDELSKNR